MKSPEQAVNGVKRRLVARWHLAVTGSDENGWPHRVTLGRATKAALEADFPAALKWAVGWRDWAQRRGLALDWENRLVMGTDQPMPTHLIVPDPEAAARLVGEGWSVRLTRAASRRDALLFEFPHVNVADMLRASDTLGDLDFDLLCRAGKWFSTHDTSGLTPRQVPIDGLHSKWLNAHHALIRALANKNDLGLTKRPTRVHYTYLDPAYLQSGARKHDSITLGDTASPAYLPDVVIILENKDTAVYFPPVRRGIAVEGEGSKAPGVMARLPWLLACPRVFYWGDIDATGYEIVHRLRASGVNATTLLMDQDAYVMYERFGSWTDERGQPIPCAKCKPLPRLCASERAMYERLTNPRWTRVRRVEQERIPLDIAVDQLTAALDTSTSNPSTIAL